MRNFAGICIALLGAAGAAVAAPEIHGDLISEYRDAEFVHPAADGVAPLDNSRPSTWRFVQADLSIHDYLGDYNEVFARATFAPSVPNIVNEAWISQDGIGPGRLTAGQFYKPRGAPLPSLGLSIPTLLFHTFSVVGAKYAGNWGTTPWRYEAGVTNTNPIALRGAQVGDAFLFGRPNAGARWSGPVEAYGHLGYADGGAWGSVDASITGTIGRLTQTDINTLRTAAIFSRNSNDRERQAWDGAIDYIYGPVQLYGEYARENAGDLRHEAWVVGGSYWLRRDLRLTVMHDDYDINADAAVYATPGRRFQDPWAWDRDRDSVGVVWEYIPGVQFQAELEFNDENTTLPDGRRNVDNDVATVQVLAYF